MQVNRNHFGRDVKLKVYERLEIVPDTDRITRHSESFKIQVKKVISINKKLKRKL